MVDETVELEVTTPPQEELGNDTREESTHQEAEQNRDGHEESPHQEAEQNRGDHEEGSHQEAEQNRDDHEEGSHQEAEQDLGAEERIIQNDTIEDEDIQHHSIEDEDVQYHSIEDEEIQNNTIIEMDEVENANNLVGAELGISDAYGNFKKAPPKEKKSVPDKPEKSKIDSTSGKGNGIMDMLWNDIFVHSADWLLNKSVDFALNLCHFALFSSEKPEAAQRDFYQIGEKVFEKMDKDLKGNKDKLLREYAITTENIDRVLRGEAPVWPEGMTPPTDFDRLVEMVRAGRADREAGVDSEETKKLSLYEKVPNMVESAYRKERDFTRLAVCKATLDVMSGLKSVEYSPEVTEKMNAFNHDLARYSLEQKEPDPKDKALEKIEQMLEANRGRTGVDATNEVLNRLKTALSDPENTDSRATIKAEFANLNNAVTGEGLGDDFSDNMEFFKKINDAPPPVKKEDLVNQLNEMNTLIAGDDNCSKSMRTSITNMKDSIVLNEGEMSDDLVEKLKGQMNEVREMPKDEPAFIAAAIQKGAVDDYRKITSHFMEICRNSPTLDEGLAEGVKYTKNLADEIMKAKDFLEESKTYDEKGCKAAVRKVLAAVDREEGPASDAPIEVNNVKLTNDVASFMRQFYSGR